MTGKIEHKGVFRSFNKIHDQFNQWVPGHLCHMKVIVAPKLSLSLSSNDLLLMARTSDIIWVVLCG
jgi:hypothetical protein